MLKKIMNKLFGFPKIEKYSDDPLIPLGDDKFDEEKGTILAFPYGMYVGSNTKSTSPRSSCVSIDRLSPYSIKGEFIRLSNDPSKYWRLVQIRNGGWRGYDAGLLNPYDAIPKGGVFAGVLDVGKMKKDENPAFL